MSPASHDELFEVIDAGYEIQVLLYRADGEDDTLYLERDEATELAEQLDEVVDR